MAVLSGKLLNEVTFAHQVIGFTGSEITIPNAAATNNGELGNDKLIEVKVDGSDIYLTHDFTTDKTTANAHKVVFTVPNGHNNVDIKIKWIDA